MKFTIYQNSRQGPRPHNQDRIAYSYTKEAILAVVADGMGGHLHGEIAARFAAKLLTEAFQREATPLLADPFGFLTQQIERIQQVILHYAADKALLESPRTTLVAAVLQQDSLYCAHIGDSRLYHVRDGKVMFCTEDHSKVQMLYRKGLISKEELTTHPERNKVYNCLGSDTPPRIDLAPRRPLWDGDIVLLCSDGLWSELADEELAEMLMRGPVTDTLPSLLDLAELRAGKHGDNISVIALNWGDQPGVDRLSTATMPLDVATTVMHPVVEDGSPAAAAINDFDLSDEDIERSIAEIQAAIKKTVK